MNIKRSIYPLDWEPEKMQVEKLAKLPFSSLTKYIQAQLDKGMPEPELRAQLAKVSERKKQIYNGKNQD